MHILEIGKFISNLLFYGDVTIKDAGEGNMFIDLLVIDTGDINSIHKEISVNTRVVADEVVNRTIYYCMMVDYLEVKR